MTRRADLVDRIAGAIVDSGRQPWQLDAACAGQPTMIDATRPPKVWDGLALCARCPVITQCRTWAEDESEYVGIAGGVVWTSRHRNRRSTVHVIASITA